MNITLEIISEKKGWEQILGKTECNVRTEETECSAHIRAVEAGDERSGSYLFQKSSGSHQRNETKAMWICLLKKGEENVFLIITSSPSFKVFW